MEQQNSASKVINRLSERVASLVRENTIMSVVIEELQAENKNLTDRLEPKDAPKSIKEEKPKAKK